jgi:hypothetical protein
MVITESSEALGATSCTACRYFAFGAFPASTFA